MIEGWKAGKGWEKIVATLLTLAAIALYGAVMVRHSASAVGGSDSSGYANIARALVSGRVAERVEPLDRFALPDDHFRIFMPLAYTSGPQPRTISPFYPVGFPLHVAVAALISGWKAGPYLVSPLLSTLSLLFMYLLGRELGLARGLSIAGAAMLGLCPIFVFQGLQPMGDVAATFWGIVAIWAGLRSRKQRGWALLAGFAFGIGVLVRPTSLLLIVPALLALPWTRGHLLLFGCGGAPTAIVLLAYNAAAYGSPWRTGYGEIGLLGLISLRDFGARLGHYVYWLFYMLGPLPIALWLGVAIDRLINWRLRALVISWFGIILIFYSCYFHFDAWWYTRFLLPGIPALLLGALLAVQGIAVRCRKNWPATGRAVIPAVGLALLFTLGYEWVALERLEGLSIGASQAAHRVSCQRADLLLPRQTLIVSMEMSGALKFYTDRTIVRWDWVMPEMLAMLKARAAAQGYGWAALLMPHELEEAQRRLPGKWTRITETGPISLWRLEFD